MITDLHTHILSGVDDGAATLTESVKLLQMELDDWVDKIALTPHFRAGAHTLDEFLEKRDYMFAQLSYVVAKNELPITLIPGAEVAFSPQLTEMDLTRLCYEGTRAILIELPINHYPPYMQEIFYELLINGYTPILAHIERCPYFLKNPDLLAELVYSGVKTQVNADSILTAGKTSRRLLSMIQDGLVHVIATDTHGVKNRPPQLTAALRIIKEKTGVDMANAGEDFILPSLRTSNPQ